MDKNDCLILLRDTCARIAVLADMLRLRDCFGSYGKSDLKINREVFPDEVCELVRESLCNLQNELADSLADCSDGDLFHEVVQAGDLS